MGNLASGKYLKGSRIWLIILISCFPRSHQMLKYLWAKSTSHATKSKRRSGAVQKNQAPKELFPLHTNATQKTIASICPIYVVDKRTIRFQTFSSPIVHFSMQYNKLPDTKQRPGKGKGQVLRLCGFKYLIYVVGFNIVP